LLVCIQSRFLWQSLDDTTIPPETTLQYLL
jgi:hypothetical protein